ncbi:MAG TPA: PilN domain-containing protein [Actinomycetota bacterium]
MRINLLPSEIRERQRARRRTAAAAVVGLLVLAAVGAFYFLQQVRLSNVEDELEEQQAVNAELRQDIAELQRFADLEAELLATRGLLDELLKNQVLWSGVLRDVSLVIPGTSWLTALEGSVTAEAAPATGDVQAAPDAQPGIVGQISFTGTAFDHRTVALWLARLEDVGGFINPWLSSSQKSEIGTTEVVDFNSSVDLSEDAVTPPGGRR